MKTRLGCTMVWGATLLLLTMSSADAQHGGYGHHGGYGSGYSAVHHHSGYGGYGGYHHGGGYSYVAPSYRVGWSPTLYGYRVGGGYGYGLSRGYGYGLGYGGYPLYRPRLNYISSAYLGGYGGGGLYPYSYPYYSGLYGFSGWGWPYYGSSYYSYFGLPYYGSSLAYAPSYGGYYGGVVYRPYVTTSQYVYTPTYYSATYIPGVVSYGAVCGAYGYSSVCCGY